MSDIKEIVVISGKGGTGKTTITACLTDYIPNKIILDTDVDAANLYILMKPTTVKSTNFFGKPVAAIQPDRCISCGKCRDLCRFHAIDIQSGKYHVNELSCEGCTLCQLACPVNAVEMNDRVVGEWYISETERGDFFHARLIPGAENSGSLVTMVKKQAKQRALEKNINLLLIDGPPGIGCPVISAISGTTLALIVTEPTYSGISDLERILNLTAHFKIKSGIVINRFDINTNNTLKIEQFAHKKGVKVYAKIPHSHCIREELSQRNIPSRQCPQLAKEIEKLYNFLQTELKELK